MRHSKPWRTNRARVLRSAPVSAEATLWSRLRNRRLGGHKFIRQAPIGDHFADFLCREHRLVVEVDGGTHAEPDEIARDTERTAAMERLGYHVVRVQNRDVYDAIDRVLDYLLAELQRKRD